MDASMPAGAGQPPRPSGFPRTLAALVVALFFLWGGITSLNDILIPKLRALFQLGHFGAMLPQFAFFIGYLAFSVPAGMLVARLGYLRAIVAGLAVMAAGCLLFVPATDSGIYASFLGALLVVAAGITILQVAANPLITLLGDPATAQSRLTLSQAFNSLGTTLAPYVGAQLILGPQPADPSALSGAALRAYRAGESAVIAHAYLGLAATLLVVAAVFWLRRDALRGTVATEPAGLAGSLSLLKRPRLAFGVAAMFFYVGAEVSIGSMLATFLERPDTLALAPRTAGERVALYWGAAMVGRFAGAAALKIFPPGRMLVLAAVGAGTLAAAAALGSGPFAGWSLIAVGLFHSIMFPTIFSLAVAGLGNRTPQGSALLCMAIVGGAVVPLATGAVADAATLAAGLWVPVACHAVIAGFGGYVARGRDAAQAA